MRKILIAFTAIFVLFGASAVYAAAEEKKDVSAKAETTDKRVEPGNTIVQVVLGPMFDIKNWGSNPFTLGLTFGGKTFRFGVSYIHSSVAGVTVNSARPYMLIDIPFSFDIGQKSQLAIGPVIDFGPAFGFGGGAKLIDVMILGYGLDVKYYFNNNIGVSLTPVHFSNSFTTYTTGGGIAGTFTKQFRMTYDLLFSFLLRF
jgi:hypothetical protein